MSVFRVPYALSACAILAIVVAMWAGVLTASAPGRDVPIFLDDHAFVENRYGLQLGSWREAISAEMSTPLAGRPLVAWSFACNYWFTGFDPVSFRVTNAVLHVLNGMLAGIYGWLLFRGSRCYESASSEAWAAVVPWWVALVWVLHPLHAECLTYISQRTELLLGMCVLGSLICAQLGMASPRAWLWEVGCLLWALAGVGSKETAILLPLLIVIVDRAQWEGTWAELWHRRLRLYGLLGVSLVVGLIGMAQQPRGTTVGWDGPLNSVTYATAQLAIVGSYLQQSVVPLRQILDYGDAAHFSNSEMLMGAGLIALVGSAVIAGAQLDRKIAACGLIAGLYLAPSSSIVPIQTEIGAERRMYLPLLLLLLGGGLGVCALGKKIPRARSLAALAGLLIVAALAGGEWSLSRARHRLLGDPVALWQQESRWQPRNWRDWEHLGQAQLAAGDRSSAVNSFRRAIEVGPTRRSPYLALAGAGEPQQALELLTQRKPNPTEQFEAAIAGGYLLSGLGHCREGLQFLLSADAQLEVPTELRWLAADFYQTAAMNSIACGDYDLAERMTARALRSSLNGPRSDSLITQAMIAWRRGRERDAMDVFLQVLEDFPSQANRVAQTLSGSTADATLGISTFRRAIEQRPDCTRLYPGLAFLEKTQGLYAESAQTIADGLTRDPHNTDLLRMQAELKP